MKEYFAGCNYWINSGKYPEEPLGTATSMHVCDGCDKFEVCDMKKETLIWELKPTE